MRLRVAPRALRWIVMRAKFTLEARVGGKFIAVEIKNGAPLAPVGASSYYVRFTDEAGKRQRRPLGKDLSAAFTEFRNLELSREEKSRLAVQPSQPTANIENLSLRKLGKSVARLTVGLQNAVEVQSKYQITLGQMRGELASLTMLVNSLLDPKRHENGIEPHMSLREAARRAGVDSKTLKRWMAAELRICFPHMRHGAKILGVLV